MQDMIEERLEQLETLISDSAPEEEIEELFHSVKAEFDEIKDEYQFNRNKGNLARKIEKRLKQIRLDFDFYDEAAELDRMLPNRHDKGFDEDSYSNMYDD